MDTRRAIENELFLRRFFEWLIRRDGSPRPRRRIVEPARSVEPGLAQFREDQGRHERVAYAGTGEEYIIRVLVGSLFVLVISFCVYLFYSYLFNEWHEVDSTRGAVYSAFVCAIYVIYEVLRIVFDFVFRIIGVVFVVLREEYEHSAESGSSKGAERSQSNENKALILRALRIVVTGVVIGFALYGAYVTFYWPAIVPYRGQAYSVGGSCLYLLIELVRLIIHESRK